MFEATLQSTFRGLPLTAEQDATIRHYIKGRKQRGARGKTPELHSMLSGMLPPPGDEDEAFNTGLYDRRSAMERATASLDESMEPIEASEERQAAMEAEA